MLPRQNSSSGSHPHPQAEENYLFPPGSIFFGNMFPQQKGGGEETPREQPHSTRVNHCVLSNSTQTSARGQRGWVLKLR